MQVKRLTPDLAVGPQLRQADVATIAALGFRSIVGNRPDGESEDQPAFSAIAAEAKQQGLEARHIPVVASEIGESDVEHFRAALRDLPRPIFAFCRSGKRSALLWALANNDSLTPDERLSSAAVHGFDLSAFRERLSLPL